MATPRSGVVGPRVVQADGERSYGLAKTGGKTPDLPGEGGYSGASETGTRQRLIHVGEPLTINSK
jgi:hypothetical protein